MTTDFEFFDGLLKIMEAATKPDDYSERMVGRYEKDGLLVSTARMVEGKRPYETAIVYPDYYDGECLPVEAYDTQEQAQEGHQRWITLMGVEPLPEFLDDCENSVLSPGGRYYRKR